MRNIVVELTNRCNLSCRHCFPGRHGNQGNLPLAALEAIWREGAAHGVRTLSFTGGEPLLHPEFRTIVNRTCAQGFQFGIVSNGDYFPKHFSFLQEHRAHFRAITFSLDGAAPASHDAMRGSGSFHRLMRAVSLCAVFRVPFSFNLTLTTVNQHEIEAAYGLAQRLGAFGLRFGHLLPDSALEPGLTLSLEQQRSAEAQVAQLQTRQGIATGFGPGGHTHDLTPCKALRGEECTLDWRGRLGKCCHLSGVSQSNEQEWFGNLTQESFAVVHGRLMAAHHAFLAQKHAHHASDIWHDADYYPCAYCARIFAHHPAGVTTIPLPQAIRYG